MWNRDRPRAVRLVLGYGLGSSQISLDDMRAHWAPILGTPSTEWNVGGVFGPPISFGVNVWVPVTKVEAVSLCPSGQSAAGLDGVAPSVWRSLHWRVRAVILDLLVFEGRVPLDLLRATVAMIPKTAEAGGPGDFRPISVSSVIVRHLHRILAARLESIVTHVPEQNGFKRGFDGVAANVFMLDSVLRCAWKKSRSLCVAILDVKKAFDSVSHATIHHILLERGFPAEFCNYIRCLYRDGVSQICCGGMVSDE